MCDCKKCGDSMSIPYGYEVTDFCNECAQEIVIELEADIKKINRACTEYKATINRMDKNAGQMDLNYGRMVLERDTIRAENAKLKEELSEANIQIKQYQNEITELEDKIEAYTSQGE